jgi:hypothetical protein
MSKNDLSGLTENWLRLFEAFGIKTFQEVNGANGSVFAAAYENVLNNLSIQFQGKSKFPSLEERNALFDKYINANVFNSQIHLSNAELAKIDPTDRESLITSIEPRYDSVIKLLCAGDVYRCDNDDNDPNQNVTQFTVHRAFSDRLFKSLKTYFGEPTSGYNKEFKVYNMSLVLDAWGSADLTNALKRLPLTPIDNGSTVNVPKLTDALRMPHVAVSFTEPVSDVWYADGSMKIIDDQTVLKTADAEFRDYDRIPWTTHIDEMLANADEVGQIEITMVLPLLYNTGMIGLVSKCPTETSPGVMVIIGGLAVSQFVDLRENVQVEVADEKSSEASVSGGK